MIIIYKQMNTPITEEKAKNLIISNMPVQFSKKHHRSSLNKSVYDFATYTKSLITSGDLITAAKCFKNANSLFVLGEDKVKIAIENIYTYSLGVFLEQKGMLSKAIAESLPLELKKLFKKEFEFLVKEYY